MFGISVQKCWSCANAVPAAENPCPWAMRFEPVPGWVADKVWRKDAQYQKKKEDVFTYAIYDCPLFVDDTNGRSLRN